MAASQDSSAGHLRYVGKHGELEILPFGTVERELEENGERLYRLSDLDELQDELKVTPTN